MQSIAQASRHFVELRVQCTARGPDQGHSTRGTIISVQTFARIDLAARAGPEYSSNQLHWTITVVQTFAQSSCRTRARVLVQSIALVVPMSQVASMRIDCSVGLGGARKRAHNRMKLERQISNICGNDQDVGDAGSQARNPALERDHWDQRVRVGGKGDECQ